MKRRHFLLGAACSALAAPAAAQAPVPRFTRAISLIVPFPAGNTADLVARIITEPLSRLTRQPVVVDNRAGGGGILGATLVSQAAADGHTLLLTTPSPLALNPIVHRTLPYDVDRDFIPIGTVSSLPMILLASKGLAVQDLAAFVARLRGAQPELTYASVGQGTYSHVATELLLSRIGARAVHVPYRGAAAATTDLMTDRVSFMLDSLASGYPQVRAGRVVGLGVTSRERVASAPELTTLAGSGVEGLEDFEVSAWVGLFAPRETPEPIVGFFEQAINAILAADGVRDRLRGLSMTPQDHSSAEALRAALVAERAKWREVVRTARIELAD